MKLTKTTALKASLLLVLAANMSWEKIDFGSAQLAATGETVKPATGAGTAPAAASAAAATSTSPAAMSVVLAKASPNLDAPKLTEPSHTSDNLLSVCGEKYQIHYQQFERDGAKKTQVSATRTTNKEDGVEIVVPGKLMDLVATQESIHARLSREITAMRTEKKQACPGAVAAATADTKVDTKTAEEKKQLAEDMKNCKVDKDGINLKSEKVINCWIKEVAQVEKRIDKKDDDGKRISESERERALYAEITKIARTLKTEIKKGLLSKDEGRVEQAREQLKEAMDAIVAASAELGGDDERGYNNKISKLVAELEALDKAADTKIAAEGYRERAESTKQNMRDTYLAALRNPEDPRLFQEYQQSIAQFNLLKWDINRDFENDELEALKRYKSRQLISNSDYTDFVKPYTEIQRLLREALSVPKAVSATQTFSGKITDSVLGSDVAIPTNLAATRASQAAEIRRIMGSATLSTARPTVTPNMSLQAPLPTSGL